MLLTSVTKQIIAKVAKETSSRQMQFESIRKFIYLLLIICVKKLSDKNNINNINIITI